MFSRNQNPSFSAISMRGSVHVRIPLAWFEQAHLTSRPLRQQFLQCSQFFSKNYAATSEQNDKVCVCGLFVHLKIFSTSFQMLDYLHQNSPSWKLSRKPTVQLHLDSAYLENVTKLLPCTLLDASHFSMQYSIHRVRVFWICVFATLYHNDANAASTILSQSDIIEKSWVQDSPRPAHAAPKSFIQDLETSKSINSPSRPDAPHLPRDHFYPYDLPKTDRIKWLATKMNTVTPHLVSHSLRLFLLELVTTCDEQDVETIYSVLSEFVRDWLADHVSSDLIKITHYEEFEKDKFDDLTWRNFVDFPADIGNSLQEFLASVMTAVSGKRLETCSPSKQKQIQNTHSKYCDEVLRR